MALNKKQQHRNIMKDAGNIIGKHRKLYRHGVTFTEIILEPLSLMLAIYIFKPTSSIPDTG